MGMDFDRFPSPSSSNFSMEFFVGGDIFDYNSRNSISRAVFSFFFFQINGRPDLGEHKSL